MHKFYQNQPYIIGYILEDRSLLMFYQIFLAAIFDFTPLCIRSALLFILIELLSPDNVLVFVI